jgi:hypothetical protein
MSLQNLLISFTLILTLGAARASEPVVFWSHFMPQIPNSNLHAHWEGNNDTWPLNSQSTSIVEEYMEHIRMALESGIDGFQMLGDPDSQMFEAARLIRKETGRLFYVTPAWDSFGEDPIKAADTLANFTEKHWGDPHV